MTVRDNDADALVMPEVASGGVHAQCPPARAREAEATTIEPDAGHAVSPSPAAQWVAQVMDGASLWHSQPPSLAMIWDRHAASARHYNAGLVIVPRYIWGGIHIVLAAAVYFVAWVCHSFPLFISAVGIIAAAHWLL